MPGQRYTRVIPTLISLLALLTACGDGRSAQVSPSVSPDNLTAVVPTSTASPTAVPPTPETGGTVIVALPREPETLAFMLTATPEARWILSATDVPMITVQPDATYRPTLLVDVPTYENGLISPDGLTYTVRFEADQRWSDGEPIDARDLRFTWRAITDSNLPNLASETWWAIEDIIVSADNRSATIRLREPRAAFVDDVLAGTPGDGGGLLLPAHVFESSTPARAAADAYRAREHVGNGPFMAVNWVPGEQLVVEPNPNYTGVLPKLNRIVFRFIPDPEEALAFLSTGEVDIAVGLPEVAQTAADTIADSSIMTSPMPGATVSLAFNLDDPTDLDRPHPILGDPTVRRAIAYAFDRRAVVRDILKDSVPLAATPLDGTRWAEPPLDPVPFDPDEAARLLDAAGWVMQPSGVRERDGLRLSLRYTTSGDKDLASAARRRIQQAMIRDLAHVGIEVISDNVPAEEVDSRLRVRRFDIADVWAAEPGNLDTLVRHFASTAIPRSAGDTGENIMGYRNAIVDELLERQASERQPEARARMAREILEQVAADLPTLPVYGRVGVAVARSYVMGITAGPYGGVDWRVSEWWLYRDVTAP